MMNPTDIELVRRSFALVQPIAVQAAALFYDKLFERDPSLTVLFKGDMAEQGDRLMHMVGGAVSLLDQPARLDEALLQLGRRHRGYGVQEAHYVTVGGALLDTLAAGLGPAFTPDMRAAWAVLYAHISRTMQAGAVAVAA